MDVNLAEIIHKEMTAAAQDIAKRYGLDIVFNKGVFSTTNFDLKIHFGERDENGVQKLHAENFKRHAWKFGVPEEALNGTFTVGKDEFTLVGFLPGKKMPFLMKRKGDKPDQTRVCVKGFIDQASKKSW